MYLKKTEFKGIFEKVKNYERLPKNLGRKAIEVGDSENLRKKSCYDRRVQTWCFIVRKGIGENETSASVTETIDRGIAGLKRAIDDIIAIAENVALKGMKKSMSVHELL